MGIFDIFVLTFVPCTSQLPLRGQNRVRNTETSFLEFDPDMLQLNSNSTRAKRGIYRDTCEIIGPKILSHSIVCGRLIGWLFSVVRFEGLFNLIRYAFLILMALFWQELFKLAFQ